MVDHRPLNTANTCSTLEKYRSEPNVSLERPKTTMPLVQPESSIIEMTASDKERPSVAQIENTLISIFPQSLSVTRLDGRAAPFEPIGHVHDNVVDRHTVDHDVVSYPKTDPTAGVMDSAQSLASDEDCREQVTHMASWH